MNAPTSEFTAPTGAVSPNPEALRQEAAECRRLARLCRANAEYASGASYADERREADRLDAQAAGLERQAEALAGGSS